MNVMLTDVGAGEAERNPGTSGPQTGRRMRDLNSITDVMQLAAEVAQADAYRATLLSLDEIRAIAKLGAYAGIIAAHSCAVFAASDERAPIPVIAERMDQLEHYSRFFMGKVKPPVPQT